MEAEARVFAGQTQADQFLSGSQGQNRADELVRFF